MMSDFESSSVSAPQRTAAEWFGLLHGEPSDAERAAFEVWRHDPANAHAYARLEETWSQARFLQNSPVGRSRDLTRARRKVWVGPGIAAGIAMLFAVGAIGWKIGDGARREDPSGHIDRSELAAADASGLRFERLPDGSMVTLDRGARLALDYGGDERRVRLLQGRARFDVIHDPDRPFVVEAGSGTIVDRGTVFDVALRGSTVHVSLIRGRVEVFNDNAAPHVAARARVLAPGQELVFDAESMPVPTAAPARLPDWASDMIAFDAVPLIDAVASFNRTSHRPVRLEAASARGLRLSGAFRRDDPDGFASSVAETFGLQVRRDGDGALRLSPPADR